MNSGFSLMFLRNGHLLGLAVLLLLVAGVSALLSLPRIEDPRITNRNALVVTRFPGASAARVEAQVTRKLERHLEEVAEIRDIESVSRAGVSLLTLALADRIDASTNEAAFARIRDKLADAARELPAGAGPPEFDDKRGAVAFGLIAALRWTGPGPAPLGVLGRRAEDLADRLRNLPGTELVRRYGAPEEEYLVSVQAAELAALGLTVGDLARNLAAGDAKGQAGVLRTSRRDLQLEVEGALDSAARIAAVPLLRGADGELLQVGDLASVRRTWRDPPREVGLANGARAVFVAARADPDVDMGRWVEQARGLVAALGQEYAGDRVEPILVFDQSRYTRERLLGLGGNLVGGALVVLAVVWLAMGWRAALIVGAALPLSMGAALFGLGLFGHQVHQMSIFGLIVAIGLLIDNAIVVTDEVRRRRRAGADPETAMAGAVAHLRTPLFASTLTTVLGFLPILLLPGNVGDFVGAIAVSVVLALTASFLVSMTVVAPLAARYGASLAVPGQTLPEARRRRWWRDGVDGGGWLRVGRPLLDRAMARPWIAVGLCLLPPAAGFGLAGSLGQQFFPPADRDQFEIELWLPGTTALARTLETARSVEQVVREQAGVRQVDWLVGGSFPTVYYNRVMDRDDDARYAHGIVQAVSPDQVTALIPRLQARLDREFPAARVVVSPFGQGPPIEAPVSFRIVGPDRDRLRLYGEELRRVMSEVPGVLHTRATLVGGTPKLWFRADEDEAALAGLDLRRVAAQFQANLEGALGGTVLEDLEELPVRVRYAARERGDPGRLAAAGLLSTPLRRDADWLPAAVLGTLEVAPEPAEVTRRNGERVNHVQGWTAPGVLPMEVTGAVQARLREQGFELAPGVRLEVAGDSEEQGRALAGLLRWLPVLAVVMVATLVLSFRGAALAGLVGFVAILSLGLGLLSLWFGAWPIGFNPILGSAGLVGVAINGAIVVLAALRADPAARRGEAEAVVRVSLAASRHILATTLTTVAGFLPLLLLSGGAFWPPLAVVIAGGVGLSVILSLVFTPAAYRLMVRRRPVAAYPPALREGVSS